jgi:biopolymer transport protein TolQ
MTLLQAAIDGAAPAEAPTVKLDLVGLFQNAAWPVKITIGLLLACSLLVWIIAVLKMLQLGRMRAAEGNFERRARHAGTARELFELAGSI